MVKVSKQQAEQNRARIVTEAARLFRERGLGGVGVDALTKAAGLTHGSLYSRFGSKDELTAAALAEALRRGGESLYPPDAASRPDAFETVINRYLSTAHRDAPGGGCALAAVGCEVARQAPAVRRVLTEGVKNSAGRLSRVLPERNRPEEAASDGSPPDRALAILASMVGALILSRAVDDPELSERILDASRRRIIGRNPETS